METHRKGHTNGTYAEIEAKLQASELYELEWIDLYTELAPSDDLKELRRIALSKGFKTYRFRSIYWALLLDVLGRDPFQWLNERRSYRNQYAAMKGRFNKNPYQMSTTGESNDETEGEEEHEEQQKRSKAREKKNLVRDDPLSQNEESVWHQHFCDQELTKLINQDVARTFPGVEFFRQPQLQSTMANILFCYARGHPHICYRQGMHELLAPLLFVTHGDHEYLLDIKRLNNCVNPTMYEMLDPLYLEADVYWLFAKLMERMEPFYKIWNAIPNSSGQLPMVTSITNASTPGSPSSPHDDVDVHIRWMRANVLSLHDPDVDAHLSELNIPLSVIGIRWYRLLFGREFSFNDLLTLWDAIFADKFQLIKYLPAAMLISVRKTILTSDFIGVYECLMSYQDSMDVRKLIRYSLYLKDGQKYKQPEGVFVHVNPRQILKVDKSSNFIPRSGTLPSRSVTRRSPKVQEVVRSRANSLKRPAINNVRQLRQHSLEGITVDHHELGISDGYFEDDPAVLKINLEHMSRVMAISRLKLQQYVVGLRENLPAVAGNTKVIQCLDGLEELCAFMEPRPGRQRGSIVSRGNASAGQLSMQFASPPVERAYAADEMEEGGFQGTPPPSASQRTDLTSTSTPKSLQVVPGRMKSQPPRGGMSDQEVKTEFVRTFKDCDTMENNCVGGVVEEESPTDSQTMIMTGSFLNELHQQSNVSGGSSLSMDGSVGGSSYEFPEHRMPRVARTVIGNRKEVELREIVSGTRENGGSGGEQKQQPKGGSKFVPSANPQRERLDS